MACHPARLLFQAGTFQKSTRRFLLANATNARYICCKTFQKNGVKHQQEDAVANDAIESDTAKISNQTPPVADELKETSISATKTPSESHPEEHHHHHDPLHEAQHVVTHRVSEKVTFTLLERLMENLSGKTVKKVGERALERAVGRSTESAAERIGERATAGVLGKVAERAGERIAERAGERLTERAGERIGERAGERVVERTAERAAQRAAERVAEKTLPRAGEMGAVVAGERIAAAAAARVGAPRGLGRVIDRVMLRIGRGVTIALPAVGSLFVLSLVKEDRKRAVAEAGLGNRAASRAFWLAFLCDASDLAAHVVIVTSLLNSQFGVGVHFPHVWLHWAEYGGLGAAVVSTVAAVVGELLAGGVMKGWPWQYRRGGGRHDGGGGTTQN